MEGLIVLLVLAVLAVPVLLVIALASISGLKGRVATLEAQVAMLHRRAAAEPARAPAAASVSGEPTLAEVMRQAPSPPQPAPASVAESTPAVPPEAAATPAPQAADARQAAPKPVPLRPAPAKPTRPDPVTLAIRAVQRWFTVGNVPVKIGMLVLFAGVAALLKYASDEG